MKWQEQGRARPCLGDLVYDLASGHGRKAKTEDQSEECLCEEATRRQKGQVKAESEGKKIMGVFGIRNIDPHGSECSMHIYRALAGVTKKGEKYKSNITHVVAFRCSGSSSQKDTNSLIIIGEQA